MAKATDEKGSRGNDWKDPPRDTGNRGGRVTDGKHEDTAQGGKRRGPGRWEKPEDP